MLFSSHLMKQHRNDIHEREGEIRKRTIVQEKIAVHVFMIAQEIAE